MACHHPIPAYLSADGKVTFVRKEKAVGKSGFLHIRCGMCRGCKADHARDWAIRCYHESQLHDQCCFITLTYSPEKLPPHGSLDPRDLELFWKRLRKRIAPDRVRYFACGEYGEKRSRPHYHACLFGWRPTERVPLGKSEKGNPQWGAQILSEAWGLGRVTWTEFDPSCARYTAHYTADKLKSFALDEIDPETGLRPYERMDVTTGEILKLAPEFQRQSQRPAIGVRWLEKFWREVFPADTVVMDGKEYPPPKIYYQWLRENQPEVAEKVKAKRVSETEEIPYETGLRLKQKAEAQCRNLDKFKRPLHKESTQ